MRDQKSDYYVYVYIDPRNHEEFYYGKGKGSRKDSHLSDKSDSAKTKRISEIKKENLSPIIRVIARGLTEAEALLIEKTLLWKLGKWTTNIASGHFADKFRPHNTLHKEMHGFDFQNGIYFYNTGEGECRNWDDYLKFGFISAGQGKRWRDAMLGFNSGDICVAYLKKHGFVGVGKIISEAKPIREVMIGKTPLLSMPMNCKNMDLNSDSDEKSEYVCLVSWIKAYPRSEAKWVRKSGLYTPELVRASLAGQPKTLTFIEEQFKINLKEYIR